MSYQPQPYISLHVMNADTVTVDPVPAHAHVSVDLAGVNVFSSDPDVMEQVARAFWDAADHLRAKAGVTDGDPAVVRTLAAMDHVVNGGAA